MRVVGCGSNVYAIGFLKSNQVFLDRRPKGLSGCRTGSNSISISQGHASVVKQKKNGGKIVIKKNYQDV